MGGFERGLLIRAEENRGVAGWLGGDYFTNARSLLAAPPKYRGVAKRFARQRSLKPLL